MIEPDKLPPHLRRRVEKELEPDEFIRWIERPIPRVFTRSTVGACLSLLVPLLFFSFVGFETYQQVSRVGKTLWDLWGLGMILVVLMGTLVPLFLIFFIPITHWLEAHQTVYIITDRRALIIVAGVSNQITSFSPAQLKAVSRREHQDGTGDVIVYTHQAKDYDGDLYTQEFGFKQLADPKAFERRLRQLGQNG